MIEATDLTKRYGSFTALDHVSFTVRKGRVAGFLGLNGAGKTTTLRLLACYIPPSSGSVRVGGHDSVRASDEVRRLIGYLPEKVPLYEDLRVVEYLRFRARLKGVRGRGVREAVERVVSQCGLTPKRRAPIGTLSKGYRQRVGVADALVHDPALLLLDEPTSGLDPDQRIELRGLIRDLGSTRTVLLSTHILPEAEAVCDDVIIVHRGQIRTADTLEALRAQRTGRYRISHGGEPLPSYGLGEMPKCHGERGSTTFHVHDTTQADRAVRAILAADRTLFEMIPQRPDLERIFIDLTTGREDVS